MTATLMCDQCLKFGSAGDPTNDDPTREWWVLSQGPSPGGMLTLTPISAWKIGEVVEEPEPIVQLEPERHFCCFDCLDTWVTTRRCA